MTNLVLIARIDGQMVAFDAAEIEAVVDLGTVVPVPFAPPQVSGLAAIRSQIVTVIDAARALSLPPQTPSGRALVALIDGHRYAIRVDAVDDVVAMPVADLRDDAPMAPSWAAASLGRIEINGGFAVRLDLLRLILPQNATLAA